MGILSKIREKRKEKAESNAFVKSVEDEVKEKKREGYRMQRLEQAEEEGKMLAKKTLEPKSQESTLQRIGRVARNMSGSLEKADIMGTKGMQGLGADKFSASSLLGMNEKRSEQPAKKRKRDEDSSRVGLEP